MPKTGPTGQFPLGKLTAHDEGEIAIAIGVKNGAVVIDFGKPTAWIGFPATHARLLAQSLTEKADLIDPLPLRPDEEIFEEELACATAERDELRTALNESVKLQAHYAKLLNMHDGGQRLVFANARSWIDRLYETGTLSAPRRPAKEP